MHHLGLTRSVNRRDHFLLTPDTFIRTPLPGLSNGTAIVHVSPQAGAAFTMMTVELEAGGTLMSGPTQRLLYVLEGTLELTRETSADSATLQAGGFVYFPTGEQYTLKAIAASRAIAIDKPFEQGASDTKPSGPWFVTGHEPNVTSTALNGDEALRVRALLPDSTAFDFACNTMSYEPGASLSQVEVHYMEHGLLMLEGGGIYRLGAQWYPVEAGDFIWMAPYCPQWFCAVGKKPAKYLIYKNFYRHTISASPQRS